MKLDKRQILQQVESGDLEIDQAVELLARLGIAPKAAPAEPLGHVYYESRWEPAPAPAERLAPGQRVLLVGEREAAMDALRAALTGHEVVSVLPGTGFRRLAADQYEVDLGSEEHGARLLAELAGAGFFPTQVLHLWRGGPDASLEEASDARALETGVHAAFTLVKALLAQAPKQELTLLSACLGPGGAPACAAVAGFLAVAEQENPKLRGKTVHMREPSPTVAAELLLAELPSLSEAEVRYDANGRQARRLAELTIPDVETPGPLRQGGVYLITGGAGGLGLLFARHLVATAGARLILTGRSQRPSAQQEQLFRELETLGGQVVYCPADVTVLADMERAVRLARERFGRLDGVLHAAGVLEDAFLVRKSWDSFQRVLAPKTHGVLALDHATREEALDFFALFSSTATVLGRAGQADYAAANHFMDEFAAARNAQVAEGRRTGHTVSIAWPLWQGGGMNISEADRETMERITGMTVMGAEEGFTAFTHALRSGRSLVAVLYGRGARIRDFIERRGSRKPAPAAPAPRAGAPRDRAELARGAEEYLLELISRETRLPRQRIDVKQGLDAIGLDSMLINRLNVLLEDPFGSLSKTLFFEYQSIRELAGYFSEHHTEALAALLSPASSSEAPPAAEEPTQSPERSPAPAPVQQAPAAPVTGDIAIVGLSGRYPDAEDLQEFWENLAQGRNSVGQVPRERWDLSRYPGLELNTRERQGLQWGSFLREVDTFDPLFFNIAPRDAEVMDPQERLFLETAWSALEDAGYSRPELQRTSREGDESAVGVFVGVTFGQYQSIGVEEWGHGNYISPGSSFWSIANRLSYVLNVNGPSMPVDTACSASLTAVHMACESLRRGDCRVAVAGGVNLNIHPAKYVALARLKFLSTEGKCRAFGDGGDGYVPGEGVGAVVLKPLAQAEADGDHIYAVIKGSTINHGGKTNGYTVPNPKAQASLVSRALRTAGVNARTVGYVEAHGTGTSLGDPIEITGLNKAFREHTQDRQFCAIGSVKTNVGHLESAAGIASLTKVLLQLRHQQLAPSLHAETLNRNIDFGSSPFFVQRELAPWPSPAVTGPDGRVRTLPRRAAISSFGAGGANAHLILEEYVAPRAERPQALGPELVLLSAKNTGRLRAYASRLKQHLRRLQSSAGAMPPLGDLAYTLQVGREALEERLALVVGSVDELVVRLEEFEQGQLHGAQAYLGRVPEERTAAAEVELPRAQELIRRRDWATLARLWVEGHSVPWGEVYLGQGRRVSLPTYPFERKRFWVPLSHPSAKAPQAAAALHPLLDRAVPSLNGTVFEKRFRRDEPLLRDHHVRGKPVVAGVVQLEMVRAAVAAAGAGALSSLNDVVWLSTVEVSTDSTLVQLALTPREDGFSYEVSIPGTASTCSRGRVRFQDTEPSGTPPRVDLQALQARCQQRIGKAALYEGFRAVGLEYGPSFQCVEELWVHGREVVGELRLGAQAAPELEHFALHPSLVDAALHTLQGLTAGESSNGEPQTLIPFSVAEVRVYGRLPARCFAYAQLRENNRESGVARFNMAILDESGQCLVLFKDFAARRLRVAHGPAAAPIHEAAPLPASVPSSGFFYQPLWKEQPLPAVEAPSKPEGGTVLIFTHPQDCGLGARLAAQYGEHRAVLVSLEDAWNAESPGLLRINHRDANHYSHVLAQLREPSAIYFLGGMQSKRYSANDVQHLARMEERGVVSLLRLARGLAAHPPGAIPLKVVTNDVYRVRERDAAFNPFASALVGFTKVLSREFRQLQVSCIDVAKAELDAGEDTAAAVLRGLLAEPGLSAALQSALREGRRFVQHLHAVELPETAPQALSFVDRGVYLILGGAGGLGLVVAEHLARRCRARLVLVGRSPLREETRRRMQAIEAAGGEALYLQADLCDVAAMRNVVLQTRARFGPISGVIHSAIVLQDGVIGRMTEEQLRAALAPKARGLVVLHHVLEAEPLDFIACFSSALSFTSAPGQANYAAASTFEDCFALYLEHRMQRPVRVFNWGFWGDIGIVATDTYRERMARRGIEALTREEGLLAFDRVMAGRATQISPIKLHPELLESFHMDATQLRAPYPETFPSVMTPVTTRLDGFIQQGPDIPGNAELLPLEQHGRLLLLQAFQEMGALRNPGERHTLGELRERLRILPAYSRLYDAMLDILSKGGFVRLAGDSLEATPEVRSSHATPQGIRAHRESMLARLPDGRAFLELVEACVGSLPDVLTGRKSHMEVMFPGGSKTLVENVYKGNRRSDYFNDLVVQSVLAVLEKRLGDSRQEKIALLEIGAGTGGTSGRVFEAIQAHGSRLTYDYTDISKSFATHGQRTFGRRFPFASFKVLDVEKDVIAQGFKPGAYDLILATNVLHATRNMTHTLRQAKALLKTNGVLVINEVTVVQDFTTLTFGLTSGWWLFEDANLRLPHSPLLGLKEWRSALESQGFRRVMGFGLPRGRPEVDGQNVILSESDGWLDTSRKQAPSAPEPRAASSMLSSTAQRWTPPAAPQPSAPAAAQLPPAPPARTEPQKHAIPPPPAAEAIRYRPPEEPLEHRVVAPPPAPVPARVVASSPVPADRDEALREHTLTLLRSTLAQVLKMEAAELEPGATFESYGVDSLVGMDFLDKLEGDFPSLPKTLLFEHITLDQLTAHFLRTFPEVLRRKFGGSLAAVPRSPLAAERAPAATEPSAASRPTESGRAAATLMDAASLFGEPPPAPAQTGVREERTPASTRVEGIAIIGMSGRYPQAEDTRAFWENLRQGRSAFSEVPPERWSHSAYHDDTGERPGTTYHRWGAFIGDVDKFDPLFFGIAPREAQLMDPQERLFLETAWATLEDAGWTSARLNRSAHADGGQGVGVFVGVMYGPYQLLAAEEWARGNRVDAQSAYWSIPNRVSYAFDFRGPSLAVDTACSSSLTAIHLACESLRRGECRAALVGGVNLILHPSHHVGLGKMSMLSRDGSCRAFGEGASGFVAGEGVGAVLLKPLADAIRDGDRIHGVILGSAVNSNGRTNGYTVPSPSAQADLIETALKRAGVDPRTISYVEAQAVGSTLADPIEVSGLTKAFERFTRERGFCALGSVKPNIGHLEAASGVAQLTKVLLQLQHGQLAPSVGSERLNPYIDFENSPFFVQRQASEWPEPRDPVTGRRIPRRAAVSSFGAGGANAHLLIEEYVAPREAAVSRDDGRPQLVTLSAKRPERLTEQARRLRDFLVGSLASTRTAPPLADVAYTLQTGREAMGTRLAVLARDLPSLLGALERFLAGQDAPGQLFTGAVKKSTRPMPLPADSVRQARDAGQLEPLASAWASGSEVDWELLHEGQPRKRLALPTYPFARERYWLDVSAQPAALPMESSTPAPEPAPLPPAPAQLPNTQEVRVTEDGTLTRRVQEVLVKSISEILGVRGEDVDLDEHVSDYGFDSISLTKFAALLNKNHGLDVSPTIFFEHATISSFADYLVREYRDVLARALLSTDVQAPPAAAKPQAPAPRAAATQAPVATPAPGDVRAVEPIAIIGMAGRFPGSPNLARYWENLMAGKDLVTEIPRDRFDWRDFYGDPQKDPTKTPSRWGGFLQDVDRFDALFFSISPREARSMDPQQRLFLETVWQAIEDAGYPPSQLAGTSTGLFVGVAGSEYSHLLEQSGAEIDGQAATGNAHSILANRVSFLLDLHGPSEPVDTACSSSLVAVHRAVAAIQAGECDLAIAGGVNVLLTPAGFLAFGKSGMLAGDGRCKTFDQKADGYVRGEGVGAVLLKPLSRALADGDTIYAVVKGSAVNHGGRANSLTAPNPNAQADLVMRAVRKAGVAPESIGYIEAHGTGTSLGDPIEINGLKRAFRELGLGGTEAWRRKSCGLGTVKTNIGHLETAAGIAGLIKVLLALRHKKLPPLVHFQQLNEYIDLEDSPFYVVDKARDWEPARDARGAALPRRAGISSFGFGGVNVHLVLEEHEVPAPPEQLSGEGEAILLSARSTERLKAYAEDFITFLEAVEAAPEEQRTRLADLAYTLQVGREHMSHRLALIVRSRKELIEKLRGFTNEGAGGSDVFVGDDHSHKDLISLFSQEGADLGYFEELARRGNSRKLAALWAKGFSIPWAELQARGTHRRLPLPTYPFARERYWLPTPVRAVAPVQPAQQPVTQAPPARVPSPAAPVPQPAATAPAPAPAPAQSPRAEEPAPRAAPAPRAEDASLQPTARIRAVFAEFIGLEEQAIDPNREFTSYGIDSIAGLRVMQRIQQLYGENVPMLAIIEHPTLHRFTNHLLRNYVKAEAAPAAPAPAASPVPAPVAPAPAASAPTAVPSARPTSERPSAPVQTPPPAPRKPEPPRTVPEVRLVPFQPNGSETPLFGLPGDWGDVGWLIGLIPHLGKTQPVYGLDLAPGTECTVEALAAECVRVLLGARPAGPYRLAASGLGGGVALEATRRLHELGHEVSELLLLAPAAPRPTGDTAALQQAGDSACVLTYLGNSLGQLWRAPGVLRYDALPQGDFAEQRKAVTRFLTSSAACPMPAAKLEPWLDGAARQYAFGLLSLSRYRPRPLSRPVQAVLIRPQELQTGAGSTYRLPRPPADGVNTAADWQGLLGRPVRVLEAPQDCFGLLSVQGVTWVAEQLRPARAPEPRTEPGADGPRSSIIVPINKNGSQRASFWVHTLLGDVSYGLNFSRHLGIDYPVFGIEQFDVDGNVFLLPTIEEMASRYIDALRAAQPSGPYVLGGYSYGGIVAFEMAYQLGQRGEEVSDLVLIDSLMPGTEVFNAIDTSSFVTDDFSIMSLILIGNSFGNRWHAERYIQLDELTGRPRDQQIEQVARHLRDRSKTTLSFEEILQLVRRNYDTITSNNEALNRYRPKGPLGPRVNATLFHATLGFVGPNNPNNIPEVKIRVDDRTNGFGRYVPSSFRIFDLPADHYTICTDEFIKVVAEKTRVAITPMRVLPTERAS
ncbi:SDR family NAD(P)-dependent oxidoreductase [Hyalangium minutum]|uniref:Malonyl CoA-acyl carrier protein transacylase n=1 Tax=Hyalangium minutum TaxID=394096 RepID=A0A085WVX5_9BACT|nr:SDR family NAD(P)-dependent oxidoreductase [Hyalangium minutum]KFE71838.1 Malonyl CoA-acyl carrier protein transacylase [Hyalangium minutum]